jgi:Yip1 domain
MLFSLAHNACDLPAKVLHFGGIHRGGFSMTDGPSIPPPPSGGNSSLVSRVINILTKPASEWGAIDGEQTSVGKLIAGYAVLLALIAPLAFLLNLLITPFGTYIFRVPVTLIIMLVVVYAIALLTPVLLGFAIDLLAQNMGGTKNSVQSMKVAVYAGTAFWVAAVGLILSEWLWLVIGIGYGGYLLWLGLPRLMRVPADKAPVFVGAAVGIWVVIYIVLQQIGWRIMWSGVMSSMAYGM